MKALLLMVLATGALACVGCVSTTTKPDGTVIVDGPDGVTIGVLVDGVVTLGEVLTVRDEK